VVSESIPRRAMLDLSLNKRNAFLIPLVRISHQPGEQIETLGKVLLGDDVWQR